MPLTREAHFPLLTSETYSVRCVAAGLDFLKERRVPKASIAEEMSVWMAHAVIRTASSMDDHSWLFGYCVAGASNRAYRDNARAVRATVEGAKPRLPYAANRTYSREFGLPPAPVHVVACRDPMEVIDLAFWRWRDVDRGVHSPEAAWMRFNDTGCADDKLLTLVDADWNHYAVIVAESKTLQEGRVAATAEAAAAIDSVIS